MNRSLFTFSLMLIFVLLSSGPLHSEETKASVVLEDFSSLSENGLPDGWLPQRENPEPREVYQILKGGEKFYLHASTRPNRIFKKMKWNPNKYPFITWKWRMLNVPNNPDKEKSAFFYVGLGRDIIGIPKLIKYAWSSIKAVGTESSGGMFRPTTIVLQSGEASSGDWVTETINVREDFIRLHDELPPDEAYGIGIMTTIEAEFAEIIAHN